MKHMVRQQIAAEAGITEHQAEKAAEALLGYFKTRLPEEINSELYNSIIGEDNHD
ncbi:DUF2780 domain-containing protein [Paenibacillus rigui]|uniref:DUF2780 domain-containing protein n=1 Tax=Paenibacillus rigui TaxID=554312 RepID=UPI001180CFFA|nr:DUF2780 domain-containing protein [Paenibacillus rigui]